MPVANSTRRSKRFSAGWSRSDVGSSGPWVGAGGCDIAPGSAMQAGLQSAAGLPGNSEARVSPMHCTPSTLSTDRESIAAWGMPLNLACAGSWAMVNPPTARIARQPAAPSEPVPESTMPMALSRLELAMDCSSTLTDGVDMFCGAGSHKFSAPSCTAPSLLEGIT